MKNFLFWLLAVIAGAGIGYFLSGYINFNVYIAAAAGAILGSTFAITVNIRRSVDEPFIESEDSEQSKVDEDFPDSN